MRRQKNKGTREKKKEKKNSDEMKISNLSHKEVREIVIRMLNVRVEERNSKRTSTKSKKI